MKLHDELLGLLQCPDSGQALETLDETSLEALNARIERGGLTTRGGRAITRPAQGALITPDKAALYLVAPFPMLLPEDAIDPAEAGI